MIGTSCPEAQLLGRLLSGELDEEESGPLERHLRQCPGCVARAEGLSADDPLQQDFRRWARKGTRIRVSAPVRRLIGDLRELPLDANPTAALLRRPVEAGPLLASAVRPSRELAGGPWPTVGRYRLLRVLGRGGMGTVYLAEDPLLGRQVAVKMPHFGLPAKDEARARQRFLQEAHLAATVSHPNVCPIYDVGADPDAPYVVLAYVAGGSLADRVQEQHRCDDPRQAVSLAAQVADGLAAVHARGIIHRDLKPGNVLLDEGGLALLTDFGLARGPDGGLHLTAEGTLLGTPAYVAPEQLTGKPDVVDHRCDLYSLGVVLYQLLAGRLPFEGPGTDRVLYQIGNETPPPVGAWRPDLGPALEALVGKAMARRPRDRFQSAAEMAGALRAWLLQTETRTSLPLAPPRFSPAPAAEAPAAEAVARPLPGGPARRLTWLMGLALLIGAGLYTLTALKAPLPDRTASGLAADIRITVWPEQLANDIAKSIRDPDVLPLRLEDEVQLSIDFTYSAYPYVIWFDSTGQPYPVYPWQNQRWDERPAKEVPTRQVIKPNGRWATKKGPPGLETLLVLARSTPLPRNIDLGLLLPRLDPISLQTSRPLARFHNWKLLREEKPLDLSGLPGGRPDDQPLFRVQEFLKMRVGRYFDSSDSLLYGFAGTPPQVKMPDPTKVAGEP